MQRQQRLVEARRRRRRRDDVGHRHDAHVAHRAFELQRDVAVEDRHDERHARPHALDDERAAQRDVVVARDHDDDVDLPVAERGADRGVESGSAGS